MMSHSCCTDMHWTNICILPMLPMLPMLLWKKSFSRLCSPLPKGLTQTVGVSGFTGLPHGQMLHLLRLTARMTATRTNKCLLPVLWNNVLLWVSRESNIQSCILRLSACFWLLAVLTRYSWKWQRHKCAAVTSELSAVWWSLLTVEFFQSQGTLMIQRKEKWQCALTFSAKLASVGEQRDFQTGAWGVCPLQVQRTKMLSARSIQIIATHEFAIIDIKAFFAQKLHVEDVDKRLHYRGIMK